MRNVAIWSKESFILRLSKVDVVFVFKGLPRWLVVKHSPANAGNIRDGNSISRLGRSSRRGHGNPLQHPCLENPMAGKPADCISLHRTESDTTEVS